MAMNISPAYLEFPDSNTDSSRHLYVINSGKERLIFKVKTTAPKVFCVKPNLSIVGPGETHEVTIIRLGSKAARPAPSHKDKFLLISAPVDTHDYDSDLSKLWTYVDGNAKDKMQNKKIKVVYKDESGGSADSAGSGAAGDAANESVADYTAQDSLLASPEKSVNGDSFSSAVPQSDSALKSRSQSATESARREIQSESQQLKKKPVAASSVAPAVAVKPASKSLSQSPGVSVKFVLLLVLVAFFAGWKFF